MNPFAFADPITGKTVLFQPLEARTYEYECPGCGGTHHLDAGSPKRPHVILSPDGSATLKYVLRCPQSCGWGVRVMLGKAESIR